MKSRRRRTSADEGEPDRDLESDEDIIPASAHNKNVSTIEIPQSVPASSSKSPVIVANNEPGSRQPRVPRSGKFFLHDDRKRQGGSRARFPHSGLSAPDSEWKHDKYEEIVIKELRKPHERTKQRHFQSNHGKDDQHHKETKKPNAESSSGKNMTQPASTANKVNIAIEEPNVAKTKLNPKAKEFQPHIYSFIPQPVCESLDFQHPVAPGHYPWVPQTNHFLSSTPVHSFGNTVQFTTKRKPIVSDKPLGINAAIGNSF